MRLGCFGYLKDLDGIQRAGFDSAEMDMMELSKMTDAQFKEFVRFAADTKIGFEAFAGFMPLTERIHNPVFPMEKWFEYARIMIDRTAGLGAKLWPLGMGKCRSIPADVDPQKAWDRLRSFFGGIAQIAAPYGVNICVEPLGPANSNILNTIKESAEFVMGIGLPNLKIMCDMRHMVRNRESWEDIITWKNEIVHAHIDYPLGEDRRFPDSNDGYDYTQYLSALQRADYRGILSTEALVYEDLAAEGGRCVHMLRRLLE